MGGAERIAAAFEAARDQGRAALMPYLMAGFPDLEASRQVISAYARAGADVIELGVPFSDPLADGPVIHDAATRALTNGTGLAEALEVGEAVSGEVPVVAMVYANMVLALGPDRFAERLASAGMAGVIVPDFPPEEAADLRTALAGHGLAFVPLVAPTTPAYRRREICEAAEGFVYVVSDTRTTGEREAMPEQLAELVAAVRRDADVPAAVGFGIGTPEQAAEVGAIADGVIVGSRLVRAAGQATDGAGAAAAVAEFIEASLRAMAGADRARS